MSKNRRAERRTLHNLFTLEYIQTNDRVHQDRDGTDSIRNLLIDYGVSKDFRILYKQYRHQGADADWAMFAAASEVLEDVADLMLNEYAIMLSRCGSATCEQ